MGWSDTGPPNSGMHAKSTARVVTAQSARRDRRAHHTAAMRKSALGPASFMIGRKRSSDCPPAPAQFCALHGPYESGLQVPKRRWFTHDISAMAGALATKYANTCAARSRHRPVSAKVTPTPTHEATAMT